MTNIHIPKTGSTVEINVVIYIRDKNAIAPTNYDRRILSRHFWINHRMPNMPGIVFNYEICVSYFDSIIQFAIFIKFSLFEIVFTYNEF